MGLSSTKLWTLVVVLLETYFSISLVLNYVHQRYPILWSGMEWSCSVSESVIFFQFSDKKGQNTKFIDWEAWQPAFGLQKHSRRMCVYDFGRGEHLFDALRHNYLYDFVDARICCPLASEDRVSTSGILKRIGKFLYTSQLISCTEDLRILRE